MDRSQKTNSIARHIREMGRPIDQGSAVEAALTDLSDENLATAVESNSCEWIRFQGRLPWVEFHDDADVYWLFAGDAWPRNTVAAAHFTPARGAC